ncbi:purine nucleosidase [Georgenia satyanarayanai]|uniref:Purine nucleosidase n=1 Tax=Georgenia satyanarayanai TaxID=860221 RepID=A0A2Y9AHM8_9MICO|nr:nucleoside hydrolase [Georgenia satyanarayanai]PYF99880.1 purine nucleosidase [Georgenia satyanarayanai]SSA41867.1 purine nucleosidase [Georgenia satyanarayanai]
MTEKIVLDCDPGHDDALAILLAAGDPRCELLAVTTVAGNQTIDKVTHNARAVCTVAGVDVPVARGAARPLVREPIVAPDYHGDSGLDGPVLPAPTVGLDERRAAELIVETVLAHEPGTVTLVPTGPLTNIALALALEPRLAGFVKRVVLMGGSYTRGNRTPAAEFNILADPEAADAVFAASWPVTMVGLDLTHQALADDAFRDRVRALGTPLAAFVDELLEFFAESYARRGFPAPAVHDLCAVAAVLEPDVMTYRDAFVTVETAGRWTTGMTVTDFDGDLGRPLATSVAVGLDRERLWDMTVAAVATLGS